jgi:hypothetical protein
MCSYLTNVVWLLVRWLAVKQARVLFYCILVRVFEVILAEQTSDEETSAVNM